VKKPGTPVQAVPQNMPILVIFDWKPNLAALWRRIRKAGVQLRNDTQKDLNAQGFFVVQSSHGEEAMEKIIDNFTLLPSNCLGVVLISSPGCVIPRSDLSAELIQVMATAGP
jgi:hypothetical protein